MDHHTNPFAAAAPRLPPPSKHRRNVSQSPTRGTHRGSVTEDIFRDFAPARILDAFNKPTGRLKASMDAASLVDRDVGLRAAVASTKMLNWVRELDAWEWPDVGGCVGFEMPRRDQSATENGADVKYLGSLPATTVSDYERRIDAIHIELEEINMEGIMAHVLNTHKIPSRPSSSASNISATYSATFTKMEDFTAVVTATVLKSLPNLGKLKRLMDVWNVRIEILQRVPRLLNLFSEADTALESGWTTILAPGVDTASENTLSRETFEVVRNVLQEKVGKLARDVDHMLDRLEGREDTLPNAWMDRMEDIEQDYSSWTVAGDRRVREGEWAKQAKLRKQQEEQEDARRKAEFEAHEQAEREAEEAQKVAESEEERRAQSAMISNVQTENDGPGQDAVPSPPILVHNNTQHERKKIEEAYAGSPALQSGGDDKVVFKDNTPAPSQTVEQSLPESTPIVLSIVGFSGFTSNEDAESRETKATVGIQESDAPSTADADPYLLGEAKLSGAAAHDSLEPKLVEAGSGDTIRVHSDCASVDQADTHAATEVSKDRSVESSDLISDAYLQRDVQGSTSSSETQPKLEVHATSEVDQHPLESLPGNTQLHLSKDLGDDEHSQYLTDSINERQELLGFQPIHSIEIIPSAPVQIPRSAPKNSISSSRVYVPPSSSWDDSSASEASEDELEDDVIDMQDLPQHTNGLLESSAQSSGTVASVPLSPQKAALEAARMEREEVKRLKAILEARRLSIANPGVAKYLRGWSPEDDGAVFASAYGAGYQGGMSMEVQSPPHELVPQHGHQVPFFNSSIFTSLDGTREFTISGSPPVSPRNISHFGSKLISSTMTEQLSSPADSDLSKAHQPSHTMLQDSPQMNAVQKPEIIRTVGASQSPRHTTPLSGSPVSESHGSSRSTPRILHTPTFGPVDDEMDAVKAEANVPFTTPTKSREERMTLKLPSNRMKFSAKTGTFIRSETPPKIVEASSVLTKSPVYDEFSVKSLPDIPKESFQHHGYSSAEPTPQIFDAEPTQYFRPRVSPVTSFTSLNSRSSTSDLNTEQEDNGKSDNETLTTSASTEMPLPNGVAENHAPSMSITGTSFGQDVLPMSALDGAAESKLEHDIELKECKPQHTAFRKASITSIGSASRIVIARKDSATSNTSTVVNSAPKSPASPRRRSPPPLRPITPPSLRTIDAYDPDDLSPSIRRHRNGKSHDYTSPDSPPAIPDVANRSPISPRALLSFSSSSDLLGSPTSPVHAPAIPSNLATSPKKGSTDEQLQQQISTLLESIPARIRLTNAANPSPAVEPLAVKKTRRSVGSVLRSSSSFSNHSRAPTPSFTLAPAHSSTQPRQRSNNGNSEIKVYHLSRSTGEAPIKLFVRLVGEHGERVMVRVGGGWADLGEYLKEYASHHGRRAPVGDHDKIEIQDLPSSRNVSASSYASQNGRASPALRPTSSLSHRPSSRLNTRKVRKSMGDSLDLPSPFSVGGVSSNRTPSTPLPSTSSSSALSRSPLETPTSSSPIIQDSHEKERSSSRMSWIEDDSNTLGLAGPKGRKVKISERDQEWVESMKEKVRVASAEKDREREREMRRRSVSGGGAGGLGAGIGVGVGVGVGGVSGVVGRRRDASFGELESVGSTRRLFRKT